MNVETVAVDRSSSSAVPAAPRLPMDLVCATDTSLVRVRPPEVSVREGAVLAMSDVEKAFCAAVAAQADQREAGFLGRALADLCVTGRKARKNWDTWSKTNGRSSFDAHASKISSAASAAKKTAAWNDLFDRVEAVLAHLDAPEGERKRFLPAKGSQWIATNASVDVPRGPVNNGRTAGSERVISITVPPLGQKPFAVRYIVIGDLSKAKEVVLYLHGLGSRAEEGEGVGHALLKANPDIALVAPDLPWNGYTMAPPLAGADLALDYDWDGAPNRRFPALEALECFVAEFVSKVPGLKDKLACVAGGSLGGTLTMRLSSEKSAWRPPRAAMWSPAGLWEPQNAVPIKHKEVCAPILAAATMAEMVGQPPDSAWVARVRYFVFNFIEDHQPFAGHNFESWWSAEYLKSDQGKSHMNGAIDDRLELYRDSLRRMQFRLAYEQLCFSMSRPNRLDQIGGLTDTKSERPLLLLCGTEDNQPNVNIWDRMQDLAKAKRNHTGHAVWIKGAGHSLHDECPAQVAQYIQQLLAM